MTQRIRILTARLLRWWARRIDAMEVDTMVQRSAMIEAATKVRVVAQRLDPYVATCAVCEMALTKGDCTDGPGGHVCSLAALTAFHERQRAWVDGGEVEA